MKSLCPPFYTLIHSTYKSEPSKLIVSNSKEVILCQEGTTQGDPDAKHMYAIATHPIIDELDLYLAKQFQLSLTRHHFIR